MMMFSTQNSRTSSSTLIGFLILYVTFLFLCVGSIIHLFEDLFVQQEGSALHEVSFPQERERERES